MSMLDLIEVFDKLKEINSISVVDYEEFITRLVDIPPEGLEVYRQFLNYQVEEVGMSLIKVASEDSTTSDEEKGHLVALGVFLWGFYGGVAYGKTLREDDEGD